MTTTYALRLKPGQDLKNSLQAIVKEFNINAGWLVTCAGSLTRYHLRFANQKEGTKASGFFEILSLTGTLSNDGLHLHICLANEKGETIGGHLLEGNLIYTTAEIVLQWSDEFEFTRQTDETTGLKELNITYQ